MAPKRQRSEDPTVAHHSPVSEHERSGRFNYSSLTKPAAQIRLLTILPEEEDASIACCMRTFNSADAPPYSAFSYTWGPAEPACTIEIDGYELSVRYNCFYALWQARTLATLKAPFGNSDLDEEPADSPNDPGERFFWIDAVCIDQNDLDEKAVQVAGMGTVFRKAKRALVSVGPHADDSGFLIECMKDLSAYIHTSEASEQWGTLTASASSRNSTHPGHARSVLALSPPQYGSQDLSPTGALTPRPDAPVSETHSSPSSNTGNWKLNNARCLQWLEGKSANEFQRLMDAWDAFAERPYWQRLWVLQELILSRDRQWILCGDSVIAYSTLEVFASAWKVFTEDDVLLTLFGVEDAWQHPSPGNALELMIRYVHNAAIREESDSRGRILLHGIYETLSELRCQDPRDRIYGIQDVVKWPAGPAVEISYRQSPFALMKDILAQWCAATTNNYYSISTLFNSLRLSQPEHNNEMRQYLNMLLSRTEADVRMDACNHAIKPLDGKSLVPKSAQICGEYEYAYIRESSEGFLTVAADERPTKSPFSLDGRVNQHVRQVKKGPVVIALVPANTKEGDVLLRPDSVSLLGLVGRRHGENDVLEILGACVIRTSYDIGRGTDGTALRPSRPSNFELCLDGDDQLRLMLALYLHTDKPNYSVDLDIPSDEALSFIAQGRFKGSRFSSYAIEYRSHVDYFEQESRRLHTRVCRRCGAAQYLGT